MDWKSPNGKFQEMSCRKALLELDRRGLIKLPERKKAMTFRKKKSVSLMFQSPPLKAIYRF
ncbi:hypothetical protein [Caldithrix abyssi]|uniref:hypothetical protein n=1 Tax=Caldithrix abyssi TaxID=187145 RepID=UPI00030115A6|nr:hypothetical protein [Caldithrix abyssi]